MYADANLQQVGYWVLFLRLIGTLDHDSGVSFPNSVLERKLMGIAYYEQLYLCQFIQKCWVQIINMCGQSQISIPYSAQVGWEQANNHQCEFNFWQIDKGFKFSSIFSLYVVFCKSYLNGNNPTHPMQCILFYLNNFI